MTKIKGSIKDDYIHMTQKEKEDLIKKHNKKLNIKKLSINQKDDKK